MKREMVNAMLVAVGIAIGGVVPGFGAGLMKSVHTTPGELDMLVKHGHIQGATCSDKAVYLSHCGGIVKLDWKTGKVLKTCEAKSHLGDIAYCDGKIYGAFALWTPPAGKPKTMVGAWNAETLEPMGEWFYEYPVPEGSFKARGFDGAVALDGILYVGIDHYGKGTWDCPPHNDCTVMMISLADMKMIGTKDIALGYPIHYGVQDLATDGENLMLANYGAGKFNFTRVTKNDLKVIDSRAFHASQGFAMVPKAIAPGDETIFFTVIGLGGDMQGWRKDPTGNRPQIRLDFHAYDKKTGGMRNVTDYSAGSGSAATIFLTDDKPIRLDADDWKAGMQEWPSANIVPPGFYADFRGYDRIAVDFVNEEAAEGNRMSNFISGKDGHVAKGMAHIDHPLPGDGFGRWIMPLEKWKDYPGVDPSKIGRVHFFLTHPKKVRLRFYRVTLLPKGVECPPPSAAFIKKVIDPMLARQYAKLGLAAPKVTTAEEIVKAQEAVGEIEAARKQLEVAKRFRSACQATGQTGAFCLGAATPMEKIRPRNYGEIKPAKDLGVRLAKGEYEAVQLLVMPKAGDLREVSVEPTALRNEKGEELAAGSVKVEIMGYLNVTKHPPYPAGANRKTADGCGYLREKVTAQTGWWPDPILGFLKSADIRQNDLQSFWIQVKAADRQAAGLYRGALKIRAKDVEEASIPFSVRVNDFALPKTALPLAISFSPKATRQWEDAAGLAAADARDNDPESPQNQWGKHANEWSDFLGEHFLVKDNLYLGLKRGCSPDFKLLMRAEAAGRLVTFNLGYWDYPSDMKPETLEAWRNTTLGQLKKLYAKAKELGIAHKAYVYGCDEASTNTFEQIRWAAAEIHRALPGVPISTTAYDNNFGVGTPLDVIDWFTPQTDVFNIERAKASRKAGHQVWWYFACGNQAPYANMFIECQAIEHRSFFGAQTVKYRPDGYLYYATALWNSIRPIRSGPFTDWDPRSWTTYHGDGSWICCGPDGIPVTTIRLENFRDGLEDYAYAMILEKKLARNPNAAWAARARELLAVPATVVESAKNFSDDPEVLYSWRNEIADLIER